MTRPTESAEVREQIARALRLDLIGPWAGHALAGERLRGWERPSNWYLTGFLVPRGAPVEQRGDADVDDEPEVAERAGLGDDSTEDRRAAKKGFFPSSMGLSFLVSEGVDALEVLVRWGDYRRVEAESGDPNGDRAEQGGEAAAGRDHGETPAGQGADQRASGDGAGGDSRDDEKADAGGDGTNQSQIRSWWQRTPRAEPVRVTLPATTGGPRPQPVPNSESEIRGVDPEAVSSRDAGYRLRIQPPQEVSHQPIASRRGTAGESFSPGSLQPVGRGWRFMNGKGHGQLRRSQVITTFGPGALIDLPNDSAIVGGLDTWGSEVDQVVEVLRDRLQVVNDANALAVMKNFPDVANSLAPFSDQEVLDAIAARSSGGAAGDRPIKHAELDALLAVPEGYGDDAPIHPDFHARRLPESVWRHSARLDSIEAIIQVHRLREVLALAGFTRLEPVMPNVDGEYDGEERWLHGAACHGCTLIAETSCEMRNEYLDRALAVPTLYAAGAAFFGTP